MKSITAVSPASMETLEVGPLEIHVHWSSRRKTVAVTVTRKGKVLVAAPDTTEKDALKSFIHERRNWIYTKLARCEVLGPDRDHKKFVDGETFPYLGRRHKLVIVDNAQEIPLKLTQGRFLLRQKDSVAGSGHFLRWYRRHAKPFFEDRAEPWSHDLGVEPTAIKIRDLGTRWSSFSDDGTLQFHWAAILLPSDSIDYLLLRTMTHLRERNYTAEYWKIVEEAMPDFPLRSRWLIENGNDYAWL